jgi:MFS family permease
MYPQTEIPSGGRSNGYLYGRGPAWFAYLMTIALMIFDYIDRQIIASMFPFLKSDWLLTDSQLGALVSVVSVTVAVFGIPVAWIADRFSRVKSIAVMAMTWSMATIACMFSQGYAHLLVARAFVGLGEAGYGSVGAAMVATHFPQRKRGRILGRVLCVGFRRLGARRCPRRRDRLALWLACGLWTRRRPWPRPLAAVLVCAGL